MIRWLLNAEGALCMDGYPIRIVVRRDRYSPFVLISDFHGREDVHFLLENAKKSAQTLAREIDEFTPAPMEVDKADVTGTR